MSKKSLIGILSITAFTFLTGLSFFLSQKSVLTQKKTTGTKAAETTVIGNNRDLIIQMSDYTNDLPVAQPDGGMPDGPENSACVGTNTNREWQFGQHFNDYSVCQSDGANAQQICPQASFAKDSRSARLCYWKDQKRSEMAINTENMLYKGCYISRNDFRKTFAGGYSMYHSWNPFESGIGNSPYMFLSNIDKIVLSTQYSTDYYANRGECNAEDYPAGVQGDPVFAKTRVDANGDGDNTDKEDTAIGTVNAAFSYLSFQVRSNDNLTQIFYQSTLFDNRPHMMKPEGRFISCSFAPGSQLKTFIVVTEPVSVFGQPFAMPGEGRKSYSFDVLPKIKEWMQHCNPNQPVDVTGLRIGAWNIGNELIGKHIMTNTVVDPKMQISIKSDVVTAFISFPTPQPVTGTQITSFAKITASRLNGNANEGIEKAFDNNEGTWWHAGDFSPQWVDLELNTPTPIAGVQLKSRQNPLGYRRYRLVGGMNADPSTWKTLGEVNGMTNESQWVTVPTTLNEQVKYLRIMSVEGVSHVSLYEVRVFAAASTPSISPTATVQTPIITLTPVPPTPTRTPTPTITPTPSPLPNQEKLVSQGAVVTASNSFSTNTVDKLVDGNLSTTWNAGGGAPQWVELNLKQLQTISTIKLHVNQSPTGNTFHRVYAGNTPNPQKLVKEFAGSTQFGQVLTATFSPALTNVQYIRIVTLQSPSWIAWFEVQAYSPPVPATPAPAVATVQCPATHTRKLCTSSALCNYLNGVVISEKCDAVNNTCCLR